MPDTQFERIELTTNQRVTRWLVLIAVLLAFGYFFRSILTPYIIGIVLAYFLDPLADYFEAHGFKRIIGVAIITLAAMIVLAIIVLVVVPLAFSQIVALIQNLPAYFETIHGLLLERFPRLEEIQTGVVERVTGSMDEITRRISEWVLNSTQSFFGFISAFVIVPVVAFYVLYDFDRMTAIFESWIPRDYLDGYRELTSQIDRTLSGFVRGQGTVCLIMAAYYSTVLHVLGLNYGFAIGLLAGILTFIPIIGGLVGGVLVIGIGLFQFWGDWPYYLLVLVVYYAGQAFEGNVLTPRLVGNSVGLHPVWVMFALSAGAVIAGFTGILIAVPVAAVVGVVLRFMMNNYKESPLYIGHSLDKPSKSTRGQKSKKKNA